MRGTFGLALIYGGCATSLDPGVVATLKTQVAIANATGEAVDVTLTSPRGETATFDRVLADTTTPYQEVVFTRLDSIEVTCGPACGSGPVTLQVEAPHVVMLLPDAPPLLDPTSTTRPGVVRTSPADGLTDVAPNTSLAVTFDQPMDPTSITHDPAGSCGATVQLSSDDFATCVALGVAVSDDDQTFVLTPTEVLDPEVAYTLTVGREARNVDGVPLDVEQRASFVTGLEVDETAPAPLSDLTATASSFDTVTLAWTAVGDDGATGTAAIYEARFTTGTCPFAFETGVAVSDEPVPGPAGASEQLRVSGLVEQTSYCFGVRVADEVPNLSAPAFAALDTPANDDATAPGTAEIELDNVLATSIRVNWMAPGDDGFSGTATAYELRHGSASCPSHANGAFTSGTVVSEVPAPLLAGTLQAKTARELIDDTAHCFVLRVVDEAGNASFSNEAWATTIVEYW